MIWLRRLIYYRILKGIDLRLDSLQELMDTCSEHMQAMTVENKVPYDAAKYSQWHRIYWDAWARHEEVMSVKMWVLKDFDLR